MQKTNTIEKAFENIIQTQSLKDKKLILAISGGKDSVVLAHLCYSYQLNFIMAHCNFQLRGEASDGDESFCNNLAIKYGRNYFQKQFNTTEIAAQRGISIQMAARDLRYDWLEKIRSIHNADYILTGHHLNDQIETFLINFTRGTGLKGLTGIPFINGFVMRPLLGITREEINQYIDKNDLKWREDASNESDKYIRNQIRHHVIPVLKSINPSFEQNAKKTLQYLLEVDNGYNKYVDDFIKTHISVLKDETHIPLDAIYENIESEAILYEIIKPFGFDWSQAHQILSPHTTIGAIFQSQTHELLKDRDQLLLRPLVVKESKFHVSIPCSLPDTLELPHGVLHLSEIQEGQPKELKTNKNACFIDYSKLQFPLQIRKWKEGDYFHPIGMKGKKKKLQDFFSDIKINRFEKERLLILSDNEDKIIWIIGYRMDDHFKITDSTTSFIELHYNTKA